MQLNQSEMEEELLQGVVQTVTFHSEESGYSVLKVVPLKQRDDLVAVIVHQCRVFAGATMDFYGRWSEHPKFGRQFKSSRVVEQRPAGVAALEKYLGSGLIFGVGPKTAKKIVKCFGDKTLDVFEKKIDRLMEVEGIAEKKLRSIRDAWEEHREIRNVMLFLQSYDISTLFAVKIYKQYGNKAIEVVKNNPYRLVQDIHGIGFFSADKVALKLGMEKDSLERIEAAIRHILDSSREEGHCFLLKDQILEEVKTLLEFDGAEKVLQGIENLKENRLLRTRKGLHRYHDEILYYAPSLYYAEKTVVEKLKQFLQVNVAVEKERVHSWLLRYSEKESLQLSDEQRESVEAIVQCPVSILTGGPGCGKTTTTKVLVKLLLAMKKQVVLCAPTGRAAQRMMEVIGLEAKTIHRLLQWNPSEGRFKKNEEDPLQGDFVIVDESSMLDISLMSSLVSAISLSTQVLFIGDADQLPSVGAGNVLHDMIRSRAVPTFILTQVFRQALESSIIRYAHEINQGKIPEIDSPFHRPEMWNDDDCLFIDSEEMNLEQLQFIKKIKGLQKEVQILERKVKGEKVEWIEAHADINNHELLVEKMSEEEKEALLKGKNPFVWRIPDKFRHVNLEAAYCTKSDLDELKVLLKKIHPWSSLNYGYTGIEMLKKIYQETIPRHCTSTEEKMPEIQILCPMTRGTLGTINLNKVIQTLVNPWRENHGELRVGERTFRLGDRVIQKRNNYDLGVFNGDIGKIVTVQSSDSILIIEFKQGMERRQVVYKFENLHEIDLAYAMTIHKSQGSEFDVVIIPVLTQHFKMLFRNLIYTGLTRAKKKAIFIGQRKAFFLAVKNIDSRQRQTLLSELLKI